MDKQWQAPTHASLRLMLSSRFDMQFTYAVQRAVAPCPSGNVCWACPVSSDYRYTGLEYYLRENMWELLEQKLSNELCIHSMESAICINQGLPFMLTLRKII